MSQLQKDNLKNSRKRDKKAFFIIYQGSDSDRCEKILRVTLTKKAWEKFQTSYKEKERVKKSASLNFK